MIVRLKRYVIESTRSISGKVISSRYGYVISIRRHWWRIWRKPRYLCLLPGWFNAMHDGGEIKVMLFKDIGSATSFTENGNMNYLCENTARDVINLLKKQPNRFILS